MFLFDQKRCTELVKNIELVKEMADRLKLIANPTRFCIVLLLMEKERNVSELTDLLEVQQPHISQSLRILEHAGILKSKRAGKNVFYSIKSEKTKRLIMTIIDCMKKEETSIDGG